MDRTTESWLNGWHRRGNRVLIGSSVCCVCCGGDKGITCVIISEGYVFPEKQPDWPFSEDNCPLCELEKRAWPGAPPIGFAFGEKTMLERVAEFKAAKAVLGNEAPTGPATGE